MNFLRLLARNRLALGGLIVMGLVVILALLTPILPEWIVETIFIIAYMYMMVLIIRGLGWLRTRGFIHND